MKVLSLFDGISCGYEALLEAGIPIDKYYASEIDKYAIKVATTNHQDIEEIGDVCNVKGEDYNGIDLLIGGSPCTGFSLAGKQLNFNDPQSKLFFEYLRILKEVKPKYFLLENVKMKKEYQDKITELLWGIEPILIDSALLTAQRRKRNYWVGELQDDGTYKKVDIPQPEDKGILLKDILLDYADEKYYLSDKGLKMLNRNFGIKGKTINFEPSMIEKITYPSRINQIEGGLNIKTPTLTASMGTGGGNVPCLLEGYVLSEDQVNMIANWKGYEKPLERVKGPEDKMDTLTTHCGKMSNGIKLVSVPCATQLGNGYGYPNAYGSDKSYTLRAGQPNGVIESIEPPKIRKLHPIECERLQGLREVKKQYNILLNLNDLEWFLEQAKNYVNVEMKSHKLQNAVENVEKEEQKGNVLYVEKNSNTNYQQTDKLVQKNVHTSLDRLHIENAILVNEFGVYASYADDDSCAHLVCLNEDFALGSADIAMLLEKIVHLGNDESREKDEYCITLKNDMMQLRLSEKEIMQRVKDAKLDSTIVKKLFTSITSNHSDLKNQEQTLITLFCYVLIVIIGFTHGKILNENSLTIETSLGYTYLVSDTQRYKQLGNGWTVPVIAHIFKHLIKQNG